MLSNQRLARKTKPKPNYQDSGLTKHVSNKSSSKFFHEREQEMRAVNFLCFCGKSERERGSSTFELRPTTGTGNEKRRTLRKSRLKRKMHFTCADSTTDDREQ